MNNGLNLDYMYKSSSNVPIKLNDFIVKLMPYLPNYYQDSVEVNAIQGGFEVVVGELRFDIHDLLDQLFIQSATWGLTLWEGMLDIETVEDKPLEQRRERIISKLRGTGTTTKSMLINTSSSFSGGEVEVKEFPKEGRFEIHFVGTKGVPKDISLLIDAINEIKPAHLSFTFVYTYTVWRELLVNKWGEVKSDTWNGIREK